MAGANGGWPAPPTLQVASNLLRSISSTASTIRWTMSSSGSHSIMSSGPSCPAAAGSVAGGPGRGRSGPSILTSAACRPENHALLRSAITSSCRGSTNVVPDTATGSVGQVHGQRRDQHGGGGDQADGVAVRPRLREAPRSERAAGARRVADDDGDAERLLHVRAERAHDQVRAGAGAEAGDERDLAARPSPLALRGR